MPREQRFPIPKDVVELVLTTDVGGIGHNQPPADIYAPYCDRTNDLVEAANQWLKTVKEITDEPTAKAADDFLNQIKEELAAIDKDRKAINAPYEAKVKANNDAFRPIVALLDKAKLLLSPLKVKWLQREKDRLAKERADKEAAALKALRDAEDAAKRATASVEAAVLADELQAAADTAMAASAAADKAKASVKGDYAQRASGLRTYWKAEITSFRQAMLHYETHPKMQELVQELANADARTDKSQMQVPGCKPISEDRA